MSFGTSKNTPAKQICGYNTLQVEEFVVRTMNSRIQQNKQFMENVDNYLLDEEMKEEHEFFQDNSHRVNDQNEENDLLRDFELQRSPSIDLENFSEVLQQQQIKEIMVYEDTEKADLTLMDTTGSNAYKHMQEQK